MKPIKGKGYFVISDGTKIEVESCEILWGIDTTPDPLVKAYVVSDDELPSVTWEVRLDDTTFQKLWRTLRLSWLDRAWHEVLSKFSWKN